MSTRPNSPSSVSYNTDLQGRLIPITDSSGEVLESRGAYPEAVTAARNPTFQDQVLGAGSRVSEFQESYLGTILQKLISQSGDTEIEIEKGVQAKIVTIPFQGTLDVGIKFKDTDGRWKAVIIDTKYTAKTSDRLSPYFMQTGIYSQRQDFQATVADGDQVEVVGNIIAALPPQQFPQFSNREAYSKWLGEWAGYSESQKIEFAKQWLIGITGGAFGSTQGFSNSQFSNQLQSKAVETGIGTFNTAARKPLTEQELQAPAEAADKIEDTYFHITGRSLRGISQIKVEPGKEEYWGQLYDEVNKRVEAAVLMRDGATKTKFLEDSRAMYLATANKITAMPPDKNPGQRHIGGNKFKGLTAYPDWKVVEDEQWLGAGGRAILSPHRDRLGILDDEGNVVTMLNASPGPGGSMVVGGALIRPIQIQRGNELATIDQAWAAEAASAYDEDQGGSRGVNAATRKVRQKHAGYQKLEYAWDRTMTAAKQVQLGTSIVADDELPFAVWRQATDPNIVRREGKLGFDAAVAMSAFPGSKVVGDKIYMATEKVARRLQMALHGGAMPDNDYDSSAVRAYANTRGGNYPKPASDPRAIMSPLMMPGAPHPETGVVMNAAMANAMPEGMAYITRLAAHLIGPLRRPFEQRIDLGRRNFKPLRRGEKTDDPGLVGGRVYAEGRLIGLLDGEPYFWSDGDPQHVSVKKTADGGVSLNVRGTRTTTWESGLVKGWDPFKAMFGVIADSIVSRKSGIEAIVPMHKSDRMFAYSLLSAEFFGKEDDLIEQLRSKMKGSGSDITILSNDRQQEIEEIAERRGVAAPGKVILWTPEIDEAIFQVASDVVAQHRKKQGAVVMTHRMNYYDYVTHSAGLAGSAATILDDKMNLEEWAKHPDSTRRVRVKYPSLIAKLMTVEDVEQEGQAKLSLEEMSAAIRDPGKYGERYADGMRKFIEHAVIPSSAHARQFAVNVLKARQISENPALMSGKGYNVMTLDDLREKVKGYPGDFVSALKEFQSDSFIKIENENGAQFYLPPGLHMGAVAGPLDRLTPHPWSDAPRKYFSDQVNPIIRVLEDMVDTRNPTRQEQNFSRLYNLTMNSEKGIDKATGQQKNLGLYYTRQIARTALSGNVSGKLGAESPYVSYYGIPPNYVVVSDSELAHLFGSLDTAEINEALGKGFDPVALAQRRPNVMPSLTLLPAMRIISATEASRRWGSVPEGFKGVAVSQMLMDIFQGDFDADRMLRVMTSTYKSTQKGGKILTANALAEAATAENLFRRTANALGTLTGNKDAYSNLSFPALIEKLKEFGMEGVPITEVGKYLARLREQPTSNDDFLSREKWGMSKTKQEAQGQYSDTVVAKAAMGKVYNRLYRDMGMTVQRIFGGDERYQELQERLGFTTYQGAVDVKIPSEGMRSLMGMAETLNLFDSSRREGWTDQLVSRLNGNEFPGGKGSLQSMPAQIVKAVLSSEEYRGFKGKKGGKFEAGIHTQWAMDMGLSLTSNKERATAIAGILQGNAPDKTKAILSLFGDDENSLLSNFLGPEAGAMTITVMSPALARARTDEKRRGQLMGWVAGDRAEGASVALPYLEKMADLGEEMSTARSLAKRAEGPGLFGKLAKDTRFPEWLKKSLTGLGIESRLNTENNEADEHLVFVDRKEDRLLREAAERGIASDDLLRVVRASDPSVTPRNTRITISGIPSRQNPANLGGGIPLGASDPEELVKRFASGGGELPLINRRPGPTPLPQTAASNWSQGEALLRLLFGMASGNDPSIRTVLLNANERGFSGMAVGDRSLEGRYGARGAELLRDPVELAKALKEGGFHDELLAGLQIKVGDSGFKKFTSEFISLAENLKTKKPVTTEEVSMAQSGMSTTEIGAVSAAMGRKYDRQFLSGIEHGAHYEPRQIVSMVARDVISQDLAKAAMPAGASKYSTLLGKIADRREQGVSEETIQRMALDEITATESKGGRGSRGGKRGEGAYINPVKVTEFAESLIRATTHVDKFGETMKQVEKVAYDKSGKERMDATQVGQLSDLDRSARLFRAAASGNEDAKRILGELGATPAGKASVEAVRAQATELTATYSPEELAGITSGAHKKQRPTTTTEMLQAGLEELTGGFELFRLQRLWNMGGGRVQSAMNDYAKYTAQQQYAGSLLGEGVGFSGSASDVMTAEANSKRFGLSIGKAGWETWGPLANAITNATAGSDPDHPGVGAKALATGLPIASLGGAAWILGGKLQAKGVFPGAFEALGKAWKGTPAATAPALNEAGGFGTATYGPMTEEAASAAAPGAATFAPTFLNTAAPLAAGAWMGQNFVVPGARELGSALSGQKLTAQSMNAQVYQNTGGRLGWEEEGGLGKKGQRLLQALSLPQLAIEAGLAGAADKFGWKGAGDALRSHIGFAGNLLGDKDDRTPDQKETDKFSDVVSRMQKLAPELDPEKAKQLASTYGHVTGRSSKQLTDEELKTAASLGAMPEQLQSESINYMTQMGRLQGLFQGQSGWNKHLDEYANASPEIQARAKESLQSVTPFGEMARRAGIQTPMDIAQLGSMTERDKSKFEKLAQGDRLAWSEVGLAQGRPELVTLEPDTGYATGTTKYNRSLFDQYAAKNVGYGQKYLGSELDRMQASGQLDINAGALRIGGDNVNLTQMGLQDESYKLQRQDQEFQIAQRGREMGMGYMQMTGGRGRFLGQSRTLADTGAASLMAAATTPEQKELAKAGGDYSFMLQASTMTFKIGDKTSTVKMEGNGTWQFEDAGKQLSRMNQGVQFGFQAEQLRLSDTQFHRQQDLQRGRFDWETNYQRQQMGIDYGRQQTQFQWAEQDLAFQGAKSTLQYGWNMQDIQENLRYATGRERRQLMRQQDRETISYAMGMGQLDTEGERLKEREKWAAEDQQRQRQYFEERVQWTYREMDLSTQSHEENMNLAERRLQADQDYFSATNALQDKRTEIERKYYEASIASGQVMLAQSAAMTANVNAIGAAMNVLNTGRETLSNSFQATFGSSGTMMTAWQGFVDAAISYMHSQGSGVTLPGNYTGSNR